jgi:hypothetical protein
MIWQFEVAGKPRPKGSMKCLGGAPGKRHVMREEVEQSTPWKLHMIREIRAAFGIIPEKRGNVIVGWGKWIPYTGAVSVSAVFSFWPEVGWESHSGGWPDAADIGDLDKLCRNLGDALEQSGLLANDRSIVHWDAWKRWCPEGEGPGVAVLVEAVK